MTLTNQQIQNLDKSNMFDTLKNFPKQITTALNIIENNNTLKTYDSICNILILGMGGSAIGGDLLRSFLNVTPGAEKIKITINRNYDIPKFIDCNTIVIASSYSGDTEETLSGVEQAFEITKNIICVTTGGKLEKFANNNHFPIVKLPSGLQPRAALGYSFFALLGIFLKTGLIDIDLKADINETISNVEKKAAKYAELNEKNEAYILAKSLQNNAIVVYSASDRTDIVNLRWRGQFHENSKTIAFGSFLPEMNHNEINSFTFPKEIINKLAVVLISDKDDHPRVKLRFKAISELLSKNGLKVLHVEGAGNSILARIFDVIYLGDWVSFYLALLNDIDPTPIPQIMELKKILTEKS